MCELWLETRLPGVGKSTKENIPIANKTNQTGRTVKGKLHGRVLNADCAEEQVKSNCPGCPGW